MKELPQTMQGAALMGHGGLDQLVFRKDLPVPHPAHSDVLIRVLAAGVNNTDINTRVGWYSKNANSADDAAWTGEPIRFPRIQGIDVYGEIVAVGENVSAGRIGEKVLVEPCLWEANGRRLATPWFLGSECDGGFAEYTVVAARHAYAVRSSMSAVELASFPCSYSTAENMLTRARVRAGEIVLITGASGGVGSAAIQLAKAREAQVIAVTSPSKAGAIRALGADNVIFRDQPYLAQIDYDAVDVVIDLVAGDRWSDLLEILKPRGRYAVSGAIGGPLVELDVRTLYLKDLSLFGCTVLEPEVFRNLVDYIEQRRIQPLIASTFRLEDIHRAQTEFEKRQHIGKIVLTVAEDAHL